MKCPLLNIDDLKGGLWIPGDGVGDPYQTCISLVNEAKRLGNVGKNSVLKNQKQK